MSSTRRGIVPTSGDPWAVWVRERRAASGMNQERFAAALGFSTATIRLWEQGKRVPSPALVKDAVEDAIRKISPILPTPPIDSSTK